MKLIIFVALSFWGMCLSAQYAPPANIIGTTAIHMDSSIIVSWASGYKDYIIGEEVDETWQTPEKALGKAQGTSGDIVCLGRGGEITFTFDTIIINKKGADFVTFENALNHTFLELGWVEVSYDGIHFERFPNYSKTEEAVDAFGDVDATKIYGYCSKYKQAYGTPFDLDEVNLDTIRYIKLIDIVGDGNAYDSDGHVIYDPYATSGSAGLDIDAIGVIHSGNLKAQITKVETPIFKIFPNPANRYIIVSNGNSEILNVEIYTSTAQKIEQLTLYDSNTRIAVDHLKAGVYILKIASKSNSITQKLIIEH